MILQKGGHAIITGEHGGTVISWQWRGKHILFPQQAVETESSVWKPRGGIPVCSPNFGKTPELHPELDQHGFVRDLISSKVYGSADVYVAYDLQLPASSELYEEWRLFTRVQVDLIEDGFYHSVHTWNIGSRKPFAGGTHPYYATPFDTAEVIIDDTSYSVVSDGVPQFIPMSEEILVKLPGIGTVKMEPDELYLRKEAVVVLWSDNIQYACVELVIAEPCSLGEDSSYWLETSNIPVKMGCTYTFAPL